MLSEPPRCAFPSCRKWGDHRHHVTYDPEKIKWLCFGHHEQITILNGQQARKYRRALSNKFRWWIWYAWIRGELKVRRTQKSLEWTEDWQGQPAKQIEEPRTPNPPVSLVNAESIAKRRNGRRQRKKAKVQKTASAKERKAGRNRRKRPIAK
jgi:hypothetical protein